MLPDGNDRESNWTRNVRRFTGRISRSATVRPVNPIKTHYENVNDKTPGPPALLRHYRERRCARRRPAMPNDADAREDSLEIRYEKNRESSSIKNRNDGNT